MKKTMFITSVIMVVVLAIALTTSSLAWFSASGVQTVTAGNLNITAVSAQAVGAGLKITADDQLSSNWTTAEIDLAPTNSTNMQPLCPLGFAGNLADQAFSVTASEFYTAVTTNMYTDKIVQLQSGTDNGNPVLDWYFSNDVEHVTTGLYSDILGICNSGTEKDVEVSCTATATATAAEGKQAANAWVAVFAVKGETKILMALVCSNNTVTGVTYAKEVASFGTLSNSEWTGELKSTMTHCVPVNKIAKGQDTDCNTAGNVKLLKGSVNAAGQASDGAAVRIEVYTWFDGDDLANTSASTSVAVSLSFHIEREIPNA